jgi:hypothetical protein
VNAPAVAEKVALLLEPGTATVPGTGSSGLLLVRGTEEPPAGAAFVRVTVHVVVAPGDRVPGLQVRDVTWSGATRDMDAVCVAPPSAAVMVAV